ncbi:MAG TPA: DUF2330 domain-containing protein [Jatrophihabitantaceae bacterium]|nr:DUF2330 domain-containing protein [Jatrophihabitantaceae bacterium]
MITLVMRRFAVLLSAVLAVATVPFMTPAWACGYGAYSPGTGGRASVPTETALVRFADGGEDVYLSLTVNSTSKTGALLFPVPDKKATVKAGPTDLFSDLAELTKPPQTADDAGAGNGAPGAGRPSVTVESRQQIGPLDVVTLSSGDPTALLQWLQRNGFAVKPALATAAKPYTDQGWAFVAVRLRPDVAEQALSGVLDPLQIHFATPEAVYPMRLSSMGTEPETVRLYVLSDHRADLRTADHGLSTTWAGRLSDHRPGRDLALVAADGPGYLTRFDGRLDPVTITDDIHFTVASSDQALGSVTARAPAGRSGKSTNAGLIAGIAIAVVLIGLLVGFAARRRRSPPLGG